MILGYGVCVYNSYGHLTISCSGFRRGSESEPYGDRREIIRKIVGYSLTISGNRTEPVRCPWGVPTISHRVLAVSLRSLYEFLSPNYDEKHLAVTTRSSKVLCTAPARRVCRLRPYDFLKQIVKEWTITKS